MTDEIQNWTQLVEANERLEKEVKRLKISRSQAYHSKPVGGYGLFRQGFLAGASAYGGLNVRDNDDLQSATLHNKIMAEWKARQGGAKE